MKRFFGILSIVCLLVIIGGCAGIPATTTTYSPVENTPKPNSVSNTTSPTPEIPAQTSPAVLTLTPTPTLPPIPTLSPDYAPELAAAPPEVGNWVVNEDQILENTSIILDGNLVVNTGAILVLRQANIIINNSFHGQYGIRVKPGAGIIVDESTFIAAKDTVKFSFIVEKGADLLMYDSEISGCGWGVPYETLHQDTSGISIYADNAILERNLITNGFAGIMLSDTSNTKITANRFIANEWAGIETWYVNNAHIENNVFSDTLFGMYMSDSNGNLITGNDFSRTSEAAAFLFHCQNNEVSINLTNVDTEYHQSWAAFDLTKHSNSNRIINNTCLGGQNGVNLRHSFNNTIWGNSISGASNGIFLSYSDGNALIGNLITDINNSRSRSFGAVLLFHSSSNQLLNNAIETTANSPGLLLFSSSENNKIMGNAIQSMTVGLMLHYESNGNSIINNAISATNNQPAAISGSSHNGIYQNNIKGSQQSYDDGENRWDNGIEGNYWDTYTGTGPCQVLPSGTDNFPKAAEFSMTTIPVTSASPVKVEDPPYPIPTLISGVETIQDTTVTMDGALVVEANATLTITNATINMNGGWDMGGIIVQPGGTLYVSNCIIQATKAGGGYNFWALPGSKINMKDSTISGVGFCLGNDWGNIKIMTDNADIENCLIIGSFHGIFITSPAQQGHRIVGNTIIGGYEAIFLQNQSNCVITNNEIKDMLGAGISGISAGDGKGNIVKDNTMTGIWEFGWN